MGNSILHNTTQYAGIQKSTRQQLAERAARQQVIEQEAEARELVIDQQARQRVTEREIHQAQVDFNTAMLSVADLRTKIVDTLQVYGTKIVLLEEKNALQSRRMEELTAENRAQSLRIEHLEGEMRVQKFGLENIAQDVDRLVAAEMQSVEDEAQSEEEE